MGNFEDEVRGLIKAQFGSVPKMASATGIPTNTIYHALDRGLDNTTTRTRHQILDALGINYAVIEARVKPTDDEIELLNLFGVMDAMHREILMETARSFASMSLKQRKEGGRR